MNQETWNKSGAKKLFDCFMEIEKSQYPEYYYEKLDERKSIIEKFIVEFGVDRVTINNYTNMMQFSSSITLDVFDSKRWQEGSIDISIGSESHEYWASRVNKNIKFNFQTWVWEEKKTSVEE